MHIFGSANDKAAAGPIVWQEDKFWDWLTSPAQDEQ